MFNPWDDLIIGPMINTLLWIYSLSWGNFGLAIILFTLLIRAITHPLMVQQIKGTQKMQELQNDPRYKEIMKKYKDDPDKRNMEQAKLIQELKINPFASCLPLFIQLPIIFGLYQAVMKALAVTPLQLADLYGHIYGFFNVSNLIPLNSKFLWMENLSQPERLYILGFGVPTLAILVTVTTYLQQKLMAPATPSGGNDTAAQTMQAMNIYMPLLMGYFAYSFSAGLAVYFVASNVVGILQYAALGKLNWRNLLPGQKKAAETAPTKEKSAASDKKK
jgi:YidC/Oxa1 family membrane protein insertase